MEPKLAENRTIHHNGRTVTVNGCGMYTVTENGKQIGEFVFSDGHNGLTAFSNSFGVDCYHGIGGIDTPLCFSIRSVVKHMLG